MRPADIVELIKTLALDVREFVAQSLAPIVTKQAELEQRVAALPTEAIKGERGERGANAYEISCSLGYRGTVEEWIESLMGKDGKPGADGKSVTVEEIAPVLREEVARQVAEIPRPQDGKSITPDDVRPMLRELVDDAVLAVAPEPLKPEQVREQVSLALAELPRPADGKSVSVEDVQPLLADLVEKAVAALPAPKDGKDGEPGKSVTLDDVLPLINEAFAGLSVPTVDDLQPIVRELVDAAVARLPVPRDGLDGKDGESVTLDAVMPLVEQAVAAAPLPTVDDLRPVVRELVDAAAAALPVPADGKDGKSVTLEEVRPLVEEAVRSVPVPTAEDLRPIVRELVDAAAASIPTPADGKDGKSVTLEEVRPLVAEAVALVPVPTVEDLRPVVRELVDEAAAALPTPVDGKDGKDGTSVTLDQVRPLVEQAVAAIPKPKDGENVPIEVVAALVAGEVAKAFAAMPAPQNGRDAAQIEPLAAIDSTRSYPRGTWAKHAGGLWLARTTTDGMTGWDCIVNGVAGLEMHTDGLRNIEVTALLSDGQRKAAEFTLPTMAYRGAWAPGEYQRGDTVSWDGSMWHCEQPTNERPSNDWPKDAGAPPWKLCVKHGRDGRDGVRGPKGERGAEGKPGRDLTQLGFNGHRT